MKAFLAGLLFVCSVAFAIPPVPPMISYQGRVTSDTATIEKRGYFKFALLARGEILWSNDDSRREPERSVPLALNNGLFSVFLGDPALQMPPIPATVFQNPEVYLRIWFSPKDESFRQMIPDQPITAVGYAFMAQNVPNGAITAAKLADNSITLSKISPAGASAGQALMFDGNGLVWQKVHVSQIDGLLGQNYSALFPDALNNTALVDVDGNPFEVVITSGPGIDIQRVSGFLNNSPYDVPGPSMELPFVFEYSGIRSNDLQQFYNQSLSGARRNLMLIIRDLAGNYIARWLLFDYSLTQITDGTAGRKRYVCTPYHPPNNIPEIMRDPILFPGNASNNPQTDSRVEIDNFPPAFFPVFSENINNRTITLTLDYTEGSGLFQWVVWTVQGTNQKRLVSRLITDSTGLILGRVNYTGCFPISYQQFTGFGQIDKLKERVTLSYDTRIDN